VPAGVGWGSQNADLEFWGLYFRGSRVESPKRMSSQPRVIKVLVALLVSMTAGAVVLMALGNNPPSAGAFCLSTYYRLDSVEHALASRQPQMPNRWNSVEIYFSGTHGGNADTLAEANRLSSAADLNCHFIVCNGVGAGDGEIESTERWQAQQSVRAEHSSKASDRTIRICLVGNGTSAMLTDYQLRRLEILVESLCRLSNIPRQAVHLPRDCQ
jgi:hypothetical protein